MHLISYPGQVCLLRPGWYERCVAFSSNKPVTEVCFSRSALPTSDCDSERGTWSIALMEHYSCLAILCNAAAALPVAVSRLWVCIHPHTDTKSSTCLREEQRWSTCMLKMHRCVVIFLPYTTTHVFLDVCTFCYSTINSSQRNDQLSR